MVVAGEPVLTTSQAGTNLYIGNAAGSNGVYTPLVAGRGDARFEAEDARRLAEVAEGRSLDAGEQGPGSWFDPHQSLHGNGARSHDRKGLGLSILALTEANDRFVVSRIANQMETAQTFDSNDLTPLQARAAVSDRVLGTQSVSLDVDQR